MIAPIVKRIGGGAMARVNPQCRFEKAVFVLGHMRCGSTALSNVLCNHPEFSGLGEAHIRYTGRSALGLLVLSQVRRGCWRPRAHRLFDKILHSRYDRDPAEEFFRSNAIFLVREPRRTIPSIRTLFERVGGNQYRTDEQAADYYERRIVDLARLWERFPAANRHRLSHDDLTRAPDVELAAISHMLGLRRPLENRYAGKKVSARHGVGDPLVAARFDAIMPAAQATSVHAKAIALPASRVAALESSFANFMAATTV